MRVRLTAYVNLRSHPIIFKKWKSLLHKHKIHYWCMVTNVIHCPVHSNSSNPVGDCGGKFLIVPPICLASAETSKTDPGNALQWSHTFKIGMPTLWLMYWTKKIKKHLTRLVMSEKTLILCQDGLWTERRTFSLLNVSLGGSWWFSQTLEMGRIFSNWWLFRFPRPFHCK